MALAAAEKAAARLRKDVAKAAAELEALEAKEEERAAGHAAAREASFELAAAMQVCFLAMRTHVIACAIAEVTGRSRGELHT